MIETIPTIEQNDALDEEVFVFPTSFAQQRLWFLDQLQPDSPVYNIAAAVRLDGALRVELLEAALQEIVSRHEALRTTFARVEGRPVQVVRPSVKLRLPVRDLASHPQANREQVAQQHAVEEARRPFNLAQGPLIRATLLKLRDRQHILLLTMHHIVSDGWSVGIFVQELMTLYSAFLRGQQPLLSALPIQYADFAIWQQERLQGDMLESQLAYWRGQLAGAAPTLELPTDRPRPALQTYHGARHPIRLGKSLTDALKSLSQRENATLFMTLLAGFDVLLHRYSGQGDVLVGTPTANRTNASTEQLIGFFVNMLVLRADMTGNPTFVELLGRVREVAIGAYAHQEVPFERIVDELHLERDLSRNPLFQVMFALQNISMPAAELPGLTLQSLPVDSETAQFELTLNLEERDGGIGGWFEYNTDLFDRATIARMAEQYQTLLEAIVAQPTRRIWDLPLMPGAERRQLLDEWNVTQATYPHDRCVHELIAAQAQHTPDATALIFEDRRLTYAELEGRANQLAQHLRHLGVRPGDLVGVYMERSLELAVGLLGILKAGGAYVPLDPTYPQERIAFMIEDAQVSVLLTTQEQRTKPVLSEVEGNKEQRTDSTTDRKGVLHTPPANDERAYSTTPPAASGQPTVIDLDADWPTIAQAPVECPDSGVTAENLAYVIYTSGSTGVPKGVMIAHRNVVNFFTGMDQRIGDGNPGVWLATTSVSFDISVLELFWTLARGFTVVIQDESAGAIFTGGQEHRIIERDIAFSLFYFASADQAAEDKYRLLLEGAKFADQHGFAAVWTPERHFHAFGGLYPSPSVMSAALATITSNVKIRAGSVVLPLHSPIRVAEEWALVDNLSGGRVGISFASGWHADDFVFAPERYRERKQIMLEGIETVRRLWRGEAITAQSGAGNEIPIRTLPRPIQPELPVWLTAAGNPDTFRAAGEIGAYVLTHLLGQSFDELAEKIVVYREAWRGAGHPGEGHVTLMLHTYVEQDMAVVRERVREPFTNYLRSSADLMRNLARSLGQNLEQISDDDMEVLLGHAFERYFETSGLFGTPASCLRLVNQLKTVGVDEIACLIDFGVEVDAVLDSFAALNQLKQLSQPRLDSTEEYSLAGQIRRHGVSHLQCTPSMARMLAADPETLGALGGLRKLLLGGEALPAPLAQQLLETLPAEIHNMYGPTETTIWSSSHPVTQAAGATVAIGTPIANTAIYILDRHMQPAPIGVPGELCIGGAGVALGYLNRPDLTAERFVPSPWSVVSGQLQPATDNGQRATDNRLYRTGDLARWRPDGTIEFLGRLDHQVKLGGHRIELGEIEALLARHPAVRETVAIVRDDVGEKRLVAYVVASQLSVVSGQLQPATDHRPSTTDHSGADGNNGQRTTDNGQLTGELRAFLKQHLPDYMIPSAFVPLEALPLTPNGKIDRRALPAPNGLRPQKELAYVAPQSEMERLIAQVWEEVLQVRQVGVHDNFFEVGGSSLLVVQMHSKLHDLVDREIPMAELFRHPTISALAQFLSREQDVQPSREQINDRAQRQTQSRQADAISRQRQFMEERKRDKMTR